MLTAALRDSAPIPDAPSLDAAFDTIERLLNSVVLECRLGTDPDDGLYTCGPGPAEVERLRKEVESTARFRAEIGLPALAVPGGTQPLWDGTDPAPARMFGSGDGRRDGGGWAAILVSFARFEARLDIDGYAERTGLTPQHLEAVESGELRPGSGEVERILIAGGTGIRGRLELYEDHDDVLHLRAMANPELTRQRIAKFKRSFRLNAE